MPRKQRFKPSRKPKTVPTPTDLTSLDPITASAEATGPRDITPRDVDSDGHSRRRTDAFPSTVDLGGESG